jgi:hypothetical protein
MWIPEFQYAKRLERRFIKHYRVIPLLWYVLLECVWFRYVHGGQIYYVTSGGNVRRLPSRKQRVLLRPHSATGGIRVWTLIRYWNIRFRPWSDILHSIRIVSYVAALNQLNWTFCISIVQKPAIHVPICALCTSFDRSLLIILETIPKLWCLPRHLETR